MDPQRRLIAALGLPFVETHISYVLFGGDVAYKIKKAIALPFLDFTTLSLREFFCREELRLNRRFAASIYLDVARITGTVEHPILDGPGEPIEWAVKMRRFDDEGLLSKVIARDGLTSSHIDELAAGVAAFHADAARADPRSRFGEVHAIERDAGDNFDALDSALESQEDRAVLETLRTWTQREAARLATTFARRKQAGFVRECHGDLHLGNIALVDGKVTLFDCIEFNAGMRWIDVTSDAAFLVMDLRDRKRPDLAARFLSAYLEAGGDYEGVRVLGFYVAYRALVRAKVAAMRMAQLGDAGARTRALDELRTYLALAARETRRPVPRIVVMHGFSGSGKTVRAGAIVESMRAIRIRSDVERKRLLQLAPHARSRSQVGEGLYAPQRDRQTYERLADLARLLVTSGYSVVVDAAFLQHWQRDLLRRVAEETGASFAIADCDAPLTVLRERVTRRLEARLDASEASAAVLDHQLVSAQPLDRDELALRC